MKIKIKNCITITDFNSEDEATIERNFQIVNINYLKNKRSGKKTFGMQKNIFYASKIKNTIFLPFGARHDLLSLFPNCAHEILTAGSPADYKLTTKIDPRGFQREALVAAKDQENGIFQVPTGGGKTILGICLMYVLKQRSLIISPSEAIFNQWVDAVKKFFGETPGVIKGTKFDISGKNVVVAMSQTLSKRKEKIANFKDYFGLMIVDECHMIGPPQPKKGIDDSAEKLYNEMGRVTQWFSCKYRYGLTDSPKRSDLQDKCINWALGPIVYKTNYNDLVETSCVVKPKLNLKETDFNFIFAKHANKPKPIVCDDTETNSDDVFESEHYHDLIRAIVIDEDRNNLVISDLLENIDRHNLILSNNKLHVRILCGMLIERAPYIADYCCVLTTATPAKERVEMIEKARIGEKRFLFCTALADVGMDIPILDRVYLPLAGRFEGKLKQRIGRIVRFVEDKESAVYDYFDKNVPVLRAQLINRIRGCYMERCSIDFQSDVIKQLRISRLSSKQD